MSLAVYHNYGRERAASETRYEIEREKTVLGRLSVPDADALVRLADALETTVQTLLGQQAAPPAEPSDIAVALGRINDQLAIQNRRRRRIWKVIAWILALFVAFNALLLVLSYAASVQLDTEVVTVEETILLEE